MKKVTLNEIIELARKTPYGYIQQIYLHWSAGRYDQFFDAYHINIDGEGNFYVSTEDFTITKAHTWLRNSNSIGIVLACCLGASPDFQGLPTGNYPPTNKQIEMMSLLIARLAEVWGLEISIKTVMTHAEAADNLDGRNPHYDWYDPNGYPDGKYGPLNSYERWDLNKIKDYDGTVKDGGFVLRGKAIWYQQDVK